MRAAALILAVVLLGSMEPSDTASETITDSTVDGRTFHAASCDMNDRAVLVEPDTDAARAAAQAWCDRTGEWIDNAPWPSGVHSAPLPIQP